MQGVFHHISLTRRTDFQLTLTDPNRHDSWPEKVALNCTKRGFLGSHNSLPHSGARGSARRLKITQLMADSALHLVDEMKLNFDWSPEQVAFRLPSRYPDKTT